MSDCSTAERVVTKPQIIKEKVPAALLKDCPKKQRGPLPTTQAVVDRLLYTEGALDQCGAQIRGIQKWNVQTAYPWPSAALRQLSKEIAERRSKPASSRGAG